MSRGRDRVERRAMHGIALGLGAALLFGLSAPCAKLLLPGAGPLALAGLLYLGAGLGLSLAKLIWSAASPSALDSSREAALRLEDAPLLAAVVVFGGVIGPVLMMVGLEHLSGVAGSLMLNLETPLTIALAITLFGEHLSRAEALGAALIISGAVVLGGFGGNLNADMTGVLALAGACLAWSLDNNLTQRLSLRDPVAVARVKTFAAGVFVTGFVVMRGEPLPAPATVAAAMALGLLSYGVSLVLYIRRLRIVGAARQSALFATAPFVGALLAVVLLHEHMGFAEAAAGALMATGVIVMLRARHAHPHAHPAIEHEHAHVHDAHHRHPHADYGGGGRPHSHWHRHEPTLHTHIHFSDAHHRHGH